MEAWNPLHLHWKFHGEHILFPFLVLNSFPSFLLASLLLIILCLTERVVTFYHDKNQVPEFPNRARWRSVLCRSLLYWIATVLRLCYMLATMSFHVGIILVIATSLAMTQLVLELKSIPQSDPIPMHHAHRPADSEPLLTHSNPLPLKSIKTRPRSRSKPDDIFIHPTDSNVARADALALQLGLSGNTERVQANVYEGEETPWEIGRGKDLARELLGSSKKEKTRSFRIGDDSDSDDDDDSVTTSLMH